MSAVLAVDDTVAGILAARNAGAWAVGVAVTGNLVGLGRAEWEALPDRERRSRSARASRVLGAAGAHFVIDGIGSLPDVLLEVSRLLDEGERPDGRDRRAVRHRIARAG
jgi:phosphonoacetaldehyde hydrolase